MSNPVKQKKAKFFPISLLHTMVLQMDCIVQDDLYGKLIDGKDMPESKKGAIIKKDEDGNNYLHSIRCSLKNDKYENYVTYHADDVIRPCMPFKNVFVFNGSESGSMPKDCA